MNYIDRIEKMGACTEAVDWLRKKNYKTLKIAWRYCPRADWMLWLAAKCPFDEQQHKGMVLAACDCADLVADYRRPQDATVLAECVAVTRRWVAGEATLDEVDAAAWAAGAAAWAAGAAAWAAWAAWAAGAAAWAAGAAAWAAGEDTLKLCSDIVRRHVRCPELLGEGE